MSRSVPAVFACLTAFLVLRVPAAAQATVEAGLGSAASSIGTAGTQGVNKSIGGVFKKLDDTLKSTGGAGASKTASPAASRPARPAARPKTAAVRDPSTPAPTQPLPAYEDAMQIQKGIGSEELLRRFGPPAMQIASADDAQSMSYISNGAVVQLELQGGKVISISKPPEPRH